MLEDTMFRWTRFFFFAPKEKQCLDTGTLNKQFSGLFIFSSAFKSKSICFFLNTWRFMYLFLFWKPQQSSKKKTTVRHAFKSKPVFFCEQFSNFEKQFCRTTSTKANFTPEYALNVFTLRIMSFYPILMLVHSFFRIFFIL